MMNWLKKNDVFTKVIALFAAILLWLVVMADENPDFTVVHNDISVQLEGVGQLSDSDLVIVSGGSPTVNITVSGKSDRILSLRPEHFNVTASLLSINEPGEHSINYNVDITIDGVAVVGKSPNQLTIEVDRISSVSVPVILDLTGVPADGFIEDDRNFTPDAITVEGPLEKLNQIAYAHVVYDMSGAEKPFTTNLSVVLKDENNDTIDTSNLNVQTLSVELTVDIDQQASVPLTVTVLQHEALSEDDVQIEISPEYLDIVGDPEIVETINQINVGQINLEKLVEDQQFEFEMPLILPNGISTAEGAIDRVTVNLTAPGYEHSTFELNELSLPQDPNFTYPEQSLQVSLFGESEAIELITSADFEIELSYRAQDLVLGENTLNATITAKDGSVTVLGRYTVTVNVEQLPENESDTETQP